MRILSFRSFRFQWLAVVLAVLLAGFAVRMALYDYHGLEGDDGFSLSLSRLPTGELISGLLALRLDIHPPLHFLALKGWAAVTGEHLLSLRLMNILADLLTAALLVRLAGRGFGRRAGLIAGLLWVTAPLLIDAGWLLRMYSLLALFTVAAAVCTLEALQTHRAIWFVGLFACALAALYTQIVGVVIVAACGLTLLVAALIRREPRPLIGGAIALGAAGVLYLPFALPVLAVYRSGRKLGAEINTSQFGSPLEIPGAVVHTVLLDRLAVPGLIVALLAVTLLLIWRRGRRVLPLATLAWAGLLGMMALAAVAGFYKPRYLAPFVAPVLAMIAALTPSPSPPGRGVGNKAEGQYIISRTFFKKAAKNIQEVPGSNTHVASSTSFTPLLLGEGLGVRALSLALLLALIGAEAWGIGADLDRTTRDDFAAAAAFVQAHERPGDAVVVIPDFGQEAFRFHYHGSAPVTGIFPHLSAAVEYAPILDSLARGHDGVWLVRYQPEVSDPDNLAEAWFRQRAATVTEVFPAGMRLQYYDFAPRRTDLPPDARPLDARFGKVVALRGAILPVTHGSASDQRLHPPSNWVQVLLYWQTLRAGADFTPRVRLTDGVGQVWGAALDRDNGVFQRAPVTTWATDDVWQIGYDLNVNPSAPPGVYNLEVMVLDPSTGAPLPTTGKDAGANWVVAGQFTVE